MNLYLFLLKKKIVSYISKKNWKVWILDFFIFLFYTFFSYKTSSLHHLIKQNDLISTLYIFAFFTPLAINILLFGFNKHFFMSKHYPIRKLKLVVLNLSIFGVLKIRNLALITSLWIFYFKTSLSLDKIIIAHILFLIGISITENLVNAIIASNKKKYFIFIFLLFLSPIYLILNFIDIDILLLLCSSLILFLSIYLYFHFYSKIELEEINYSNPNKNQISSFLHLNLFLRNNVYRNSIGVALIFKVLGFLYLNNQQPLPSDGDYNLIHKSLLSLCFPIITFTFVYNNTWGYFKTTALNLVISGSNVKRYLFYYWKLLEPALIADLLISIILLIIFGYLTPTFIIWYIIFTFYAMTVSILGSFIKYTPITKSLSFISFKQNTSILINVLTIFGTIPFIIFDNTIQSYLFLLATLLASSFVLFFFLIIFNKTTLKRFQNKLFEFKN